VRERLHTAHEATLGNRAALIAKVGEAAVRVLLRKRSLAVELELCPQATRISRSWTIRPSGR
jgi:hypothetical protein